MKPHVLQGAGGFGVAGKENARVNTIANVVAIFDVFQAHGHIEIDTSRIYVEGTSEGFLAQAGWKQRGLVIDTKLYPDHVRQLRSYVPVGLIDVFSESDHAFSRGNPVPNFRPWIEP